MSHFFQVFKKQLNFPKEYYVAEVRKYFQEWNPDIIYTEAFVNEKKDLVMPITHKDTISPKRTKCIIELDYIGYRPYNPNLENILEKTGNSNLDWFNSQKQSQTLFKRPKTLSFTKPMRRWSFDYFHIRDNENGDFEVYLDYSKNSFQLGSPKKNDQVLYVFKKPGVIKIAFNGKHDFTMSGRKPRSYTEWEYLIQYHGKIEKINFEDFDKTQTIQNPSQKIDKLIDIRKMLY